MDWYTFKSEGHLFFTDRYEFFLDDAGALCQASRSHVEDGDSGRRFSRWVCDAEQAEEWAARIREFAYQPALPGL